MSFRLGVYECPQCGRVEEPAPPAPQTHGPGLKRPQQWQAPPSSGGGYGPPPPPGQVPEFLAPESLYGTGSGDTRPASDGLDMEKRIFFGLQVASGVLIVIAGVVSASVLGGIGVFGALVMAVLSVGLSAFVLFSDALWAKYTCMTCAGLSVVGTLIGLFGAASLAAADNGPLDTIGAIVQLLLDVWLISILYRDAQRLQGTGY